MRERTPGPDFNLSLRGFLRRIGAVYYAGDVHSMGEARGPRCGCSSAARVSGVSLTSFDAPQKWVMFDQLGRELAVE